MNVIETHRLVKTFGGRAAVDQFDMHVNQGDVYGFVGRNGAGKTTVMRMLAGLAAADGGEVRVFGTDPKEAGTSRRIGALIEAPGLYGSMTAYDNMMLKALALGLVDPKDKVRNLLAFTGLSGVGSKKTRHFSMGMKQRLGLAMALLGEPEVLILDEPTNGLDPSGIVEMRTFLQRLNREKGITVVVSSHHLAELEQLATVYAFLSRGRLVEQVSARALQERCADCIDIGVSDPAGFTVLLERELRHERYQVLPDGIVRIFDPSTGIETYSGLASGAGMDIYKLERRKTSLEQYYLEMKDKGAA